MKIFDKRPLSLILCVMLGSFALFSRLSLPLRIIFLSVSALFFILTFFKLPFIKSPVLVRLVTVFMIIAMLLSLLFFDFVFAPEDRFSKESRIVGTVTELEKKNHQNEITLNVKNIDGKDVPSYKILLYIDFSDKIILNVGDEVTFKSTIEEFDGDYDFDAKGYYYGKGYFGVADGVEDLFILSSENVTAEIFFKNARTKITDYIINNSDERIGGLLSALLIGERSALNSETTLDFRRIGISHILALSGMHFAIITLFISKLLSLLKQNKRVVSVISILFSLLYMTLVGFSPSVIRAGIMLIITNLLFLLAKTHDSITTLSISVFIIALIEPYSVYDISLWLSALATLGICIYEEFNSQQQTQNGLIKWCFGSFLSSVFAISTTTLIGVTRFDGISVLSIISTFIFSLLIEIFVFIGIIFLAVGSFIPVKLVLIPVGSFICYLSSVLSEWRWAYLSTKFTSVKVLAIIFTALLCAFFVLNIKHKRIFIAVISVFLISIYVTALVCTASLENKTKVEYQNSSTESFVLTNNGESSLINVSAYRQSDVSKLISSYKKNGYQTIDKYMFTHYHTSLPVSVEKSFSQIKIYELILPYPQNSEEKEIYERIFEICSRHKVKLKTVSYTESIKIGYLDATLLYNAPLGDDEIILISLNIYGKTHTYLTNGALNSKLKSYALTKMAESHTIIFGRHAQSKNVRFTYKIDIVEKIVFSGSKVTLPEEIKYYYHSRELYYGIDRLSLTN